MGYSKKVFYSDNEYDYFPSKIAKTIRFVDIPVYVYWIGRGGNRAAQIHYENYRSFQLVGTKILEDFLETACGSKSNIYQYQKYLLVKNHILQPIYISFDIR